MLHGQGDRRAGPARGRSGKTSLRAQPMLTIGKLAALADVRADTLRYYERERLLTPAGKSGSGYRLYDGDSVRRIRFIKQAQHCGFTLAEISQLLALRHQASARCGDVPKLALEKKRQLDARIRTMKTMSKARSEEHTSELQSRLHLVCRLLLEKKKKKE